MFGGLCAAGIFLPFNGQPPANETTIDQVEWYLDELKSSKGEDLLVFILNVLNLIGMFLLIVYTGVGLSTFPCGILAAKRGVYSEREQVNSNIEQLEQQIQDIREDNVKFGIIVT